ncbi:glucose-1-phosphate adenylyltransferase [Cocleimonas flava]|uniref:Glucose-1-phosphate adenylyltransferase n=1 Tax=Cocleimonas flava TaxID=634765 RepID=A0A4V2P7Q0_9GAMM|nr:glucose-1-phosphate adenylyltransferase [Cocleimonas flava]TCJ82695.1 glucose-1-phosphate adenylyltransferase [Cocleimonas flava]
MSGNLFEDAVCILLAGGKGSRLQPLTTDRAKPGVPFGGKYRIIDFTLSNCLHSGIRRVLVLTQYKSHSLQLHLCDAWSIFNPGLGEYITAVPPQMRTGDSWYKGTADAIYQNICLLESSGAKKVVILSGDHIYRMDYGAMLEHHNEFEADLSVACMQVPIDEASAFGIMTINEQSQVIQFEEKPENPACMPNQTEFALASMGIYIFNIDTLVDALSKDNLNPLSSHDFGKDILPLLIKSHNVVGYEFGGSEGRVTPDRYWRDVGTIDSYFDANMDLLSPQPPLNLYQKSWPIRTYHGQHPPARIITAHDNEQGKIKNAIIGSGSMVIDATIIKSILSANVRVNENAHIESSIIFDHVQIGAGAKLRDCIVDKHVQIPERMIIGYDKEEDAKRFTLSKNGIVVVPKGFGQ